MRKPMMSSKYLGNGLLITVLSIFLLFYFFRPNKEIVYVDSVKLFDGFVMTKEMKRVGQKEFNARKLVLDNLYSSLQSATKTAAEKKAIMQQFIQGKEELEQFNHVFVAEQTTKIWSRIKSYTSEFSKNKNYQLVIGSDNKEMVLFADEKIDITEDLLVFLNKKYEGL
jgi:outer membrane protein